MLYFEIGGARLTLDEKFQLLRSIGEECITEDELRNLLAKKPNPICYDGFEPSGRMHIAQVYFLFMYLSSVAGFSVLISICTCICMTYLSLSLLISVSVSICL